MPSPEERVQQLEDLEAIRAAPAAPAATARRRRRSGVAGGVALAAAAGIVAVLVVLAGGGDSTDRSVVSGEERATEPALSPPAADRDPNNGEGSGSAPQGAATGAATARPGTITTVAGSGEEGFGGDGGPATAARLRSPRAVALDGAGNLFIADVENRVVRRVEGVAVPVTIRPGIGPDAPSPN